MVYHQPRRPSPTSSGLSRGPEGGSQLHGSGLLRGGEKGPWRDGDGPLPELGRVSLLPAGPGSGQQAPSVEMKGSPPKQEPECSAVWPRALAISHKAQPGVRVLGAP